MQVNTETFVGKRLQRQPFLVIQDEQVLPCKGFTLIWKKLLKQLKQI
jgi:hypothetical protein